MKTSLEDGYKKSLISPGASRRALVIISRCHAADILSDRIIRTDGYRHRELNYSFGRVTSDSPKNAIIEESAMIYYVVHYRPSVTECYAEILTAGTCIYRIQVQTNPSLTSASPRNVIIEESVMIYCVLHYRPSVTACYTKIFYRSYILNTGIDY